MLNATISAPAGWARLSRRAALPVPEVTQKAVDTRGQRESNRRTTSKAPASQADRRRALRRFPREAPADHEFLGSPTRLAQNPTADLLQHRRLSIWTGTPKGRPWASRMWELERM